ncbi:MAG: hypothetical protein LBI29_01535 [Rickettsiales bacterium]|jgi:serine/threonine protein kinase|nr:hypothetical protein [Rickettsiales bacterium]
MSDKEKLVQEASILASVIVGNQSLFKKGVQVSFDPEKKEFKGTDIVIADEGREYTIFKVPSASGKYFLVKIYGENVKEEEKNEFMYCDVCKDKGKYLLKFFPEIFKSGKEYTIFEDTTELEKFSEIEPRKVKDIITGNFLGTFELIAESHRHGYLMSSCLEVDNLRFRKDGSILFTDGNMVNLNYPGDKTGLSAYITRYAAPEILYGNVDATRASDLWSLGVLLYELAYRGSMIQFSSPKKGGLTAPIFSNTRMFDCTSGKFAIDAVKLFSTMDGLGPDMGGFVGELLLPNPESRPKSGDLPRTALEVMKMGREGKRDEIRERERRINMREGELERKERLLSAREESVYAKEQRIKTREADLIARERVVVAREGELNKQNKDVTKKLNGAYKKMSELEQSQKRSGQTTPP